MNNIALIGFMATGKSTVGPALARELGWPVVDTDAEIERLTGQTIADIWRFQGEAAFRKTEEEIVGRLAEQRQIVIVTGGGVVLSLNNVEALQRQTFVVGLQAALEVIAERVRRDAKRPLLSGGDPKVLIGELFEARAGKYDFAHVTIDTSKTAVSKVVAKIMAHPLCPKGKRG